MDLDVEGEARWLLRDFDRPPGARRLVEHHGLDVLTISGMRGRSAERVILRERRTVCVRSGLSKIDLRWALLHELAEEHMDRIGYRREDVELAAEALTAALVAPRDAFRCAVSRHGRDAFGQLAIDFGTTETCAALRVGEVIGQPIALIAPATVRVRGDLYAWPEEAALRRLARRGAPWLRRVELTDDRRRVALAAEELEAA